MLKTAISHLREEILDLYQTYQTYTKVAQIICERHPDLPGPNWVRELVSLEVSDIAGDQDLLDENAKLRRQKVKATDRLRKERRSQLEFDRKETAIEELLTDIQENLKSVGKDLKKTQRYSGKFQRKGTVLVVHLSDLHLQELVDLPGRNRFDFVVASKRLQLMAQKVKALGKCFDSTRMVLAIGGDLINSDRRHDEVLNNSTNRSRAVVLATHLLRQFILDLRQTFYIDIVGVTGNEGRAKQELAWSEIGATDSYDALTYWFLEQVLQGDKGIRFNPLQANECIFSIHNETFLVIHGHQIRATDQKAVQSIISKYAIRDIKISHILCGHIHSTMISDFVSRNSSLCGSNSYSENGLNFNSKAGQNIHIVTQQGIDGFKADLQDIEGVDGYDCISELQRHGARMLDKKPNPDHQVKPLVIC